MVGNGGSNKKPSPVSEQLEEAFRVAIEFELHDGTKIEMRRLKMSEFLQRAPLISKGFAEVKGFDAASTAGDDSARGYAFMLMLMAATWPTFRELFSLISREKESEATVTLTDDFEDGIVFLEAALRAHRKVLSSFFSIVRSIGETV